jgi:glycosyltransferase involved in cell wall biosynthesis
LRAKHSLRQSSAVRLALLHYTYTPIVGGVERVLAAHARLFAQAGHEVTIFCREGASDDPAIKVVHFPADSSSLRACLREALATTDVVFIHNVCTMPFDPALTGALENVAADLPRIRFICWIHDLAPMSGDAPAFAAGSDEFAKARPVHAPLEYVAISEYRARQFKERTGIRAAIVPNGIDLAQTLRLDDDIAAFARIHRLLQRDVVLLQPARLVARKRIEVSLQILRALREAEVDAALLVTAAPDPHNPRLPQFRAALADFRTGLEADAFFLNEALPITDARLAQFYQLADALLIPSRDEGFSLPLLEAALHRLPIFCTGIEPHRAHGLPVRTFSPDAPPGVIARIISDTILRSAEAQARKRVARDFAWDTIFRDHLAPMLLNVPARNRP